MTSPLPPDLARLLTVRTYLQQQLTTVEAAIGAAERAAAELAARRPLPPPPDWLIEYSIGGRDQQKILALHAGDCWIGSKATRTRPLTREAALQVLADRVKPCDVCRPDSELGVLEA
ncbi:DUF6233 domain-containing protein [Streptomyces sp. NPDC059994]|uniref:DUF6233 domain-containing protein n=1 Tax=Streptomyces sp. NPDC059994 TaxID=3347029 RepID=UPI0036A89A7A